jgi:hypothetical protein
LQDSASTLRVMGSRTIAARRKSGAVVAFIGCDGLIIPSARWDCENLVLFTDNLAMDVGLEPKSVEEVDWEAWARSVAMIDD